VLAALVTLLCPLVLGVLARHGRWLETSTLISPQAMAALNKFALTIAFPALVVASFLDPSRQPTLRWPILLLAAAPLLVGVGVSLVLGGRVVGGETLPSRGALSLVALFGNAAYLGLPLVGALLGEDHLALASLIVSVHVAMTVTLGTALLEREGGGTDAKRLARQLITSPLAMSPIVGVLLAGCLDALELDTHPLVHAGFRALDVLGKTASPLGIFVLGLFLGARAPSLERPRGQLAFALVRLFVVPAATLALALSLSSAFAITRDEVRALVLLAAMPAAISTFAMVEEAGGDSEPVARAIVTTSLASIVTVPAWLALADAVAP